MGNAGPQAFAVLLCPVLKVDVPGRAFRGRMKAGRPAWAEWESEVVWGGGRPDRERRRPEAFPCPQSQLGSPPYPELL